MIARRMAALAFSITLALTALVISAFNPTQAYAEESLSNLSQEQISERFDELYDKYDPGDVVTGEDAKFIEMYAMDAQSPQTRAQNQTRNFNQTKTQYGTTVRFSGSFWHNGTFEYNYGGNTKATVTSGSTPKSMTMSVNCQSYGVVSGGYVIAYEGSVSHTANNVKSTSMNKSKSYSGIVVVYYVNASLDVTTAGGQGFNIVIS
ncbi:MAG: hypothetical protein Q4B91_05430 [Atopobiaceae bacterium]|nr:hypothetical protein [Atopobiaceae bacterium]